MCRSGKGGRLFRNERGKEVCETSQKEIVAERKKKFPLQVFFSQGSNRAILVFFARRTFNREKIQQRRFFPRLALRGGPISGASREVTEKNIFI